MVRTRTPFMMIDLSICFAHSAQNFRFLKTNRDFGNPGFDLNYPGSMFYELPGFFPVGSNPGSITNKNPSDQK